MGAYCMTAITNAFENAPDATLCKLWRVRDMQTFSRQTVLGTNRLRFSHRKGKLEGTDWPKEQLNLLELRTSTLCDFLSVLMVKRIDPS